MNFKKILERECKKNGTNVKITKVPSHMRPTPQSMHELQKEICSQINSCSSLNLK